MPKSHSIPATLTQEQQERFWQFTIRLADDVCWPWTGTLHKDGYGIFTIGSWPFMAHRVSWVMAHGPIPGGLSVCHDCDRRYEPDDFCYRRCVNPAHLFLGTNQDNVRDAFAKGRRPRGDGHWTRRMPERVARGDRNGARVRVERMPRGEAHRGAKLTEEKVWAILRARLEGRTLWDIAREHGVSQTTVWRIFHGKAWNHVVD